MQLPLQRQAGVSDAFVAEVTARMAAASAPLSAFLAATGWSAVACPPGPGHGRGGVPKTGPKGIFLFEGHVDRLSGAARDDIITPHELDHEYGHALDRQLAGDGYDQRSAMPDFVAAHAGDVMAMRDETFQALHYFIEVAQDSDPAGRGRMEAYAEACALHASVDVTAAPVISAAGWGEVDAGPNVLQAFPRVAALVLADMRAHGLVPAPKSNRGAMRPDVKPVPVHFRP